MCFNTRNKCKSNYVASATDEFTVNYSIVADATQRLKFIFRALKRTAKFKLSLRDKLINLNVKTLAGKPDIVLKKHKAIIFVHGCFWHQHTGCKRSNIPKSNQDYWKPKLERNVQRDKQRIKELKQNGWRILTIWECEVKDLPKMEDKLKRFIQFHY